MANESRKRFWPDADEWLDFFREYLCGHPELGEHVTRIWFALLEHHSDGQSTCVDILSANMSPASGSLCQSITLRDRRASARQDLS
jgi:hypothetical protein